MARFYYNKHLQISLESKNRQEQANALKRIAESYLKEGELDSATAAFGKVYKLLDALKDERIAGGVSSVLKDLGQLELKKGNVQEAMNFFRQGIPIAAQTDNNNVLSDIYLEMAGVFRSGGNTDSCIYYALRSLHSGQQNRYAKNILAATHLLALVYEPIDAKEALQYHKEASAINDSLFNTAKATQVHNLFFMEQQRKQELKLSQTKYNNRLKLYSVMAVAFLFMAGAVVLYQMNRNKQKANTILNNQKQEIENQRSKAEKALEELKATQAQLIQAEKMASLGEMTAGIAHEIQNPLNFVNNFSEINEELIEELKLQKTKAEQDSTLENELLNGIAQNSTKIKMHGKRADAIVKGMLEHSRLASGVKEPTDINALAAEFLQLAYHGLRGSDKSFNTSMITDFDTTIGAIPVIPQDIGRLLLNLYNNAFYAVNEKIKGKTENYKPLITVKTKKDKNRILIMIEDNGDGIPENIIDKIFQPFFTTKPTGQGTGLGLSLAYDIVKAHRGDITVHSTKDERTEFIVQLPAS
jgi:two-component system NtrC family sensor kinase